MYNVVTVSLKKHRKDILIHSEIGCTGGCSATRQTLFSLPEVRGSEEIWRTEQGILR